MQECPYLDLPKEFADAELTADDRQLSDKIELDAIKYGLFDNKQLKTKMTKRTIRRRENVPHNQNSKREARRQKIGLRDEQSLITIARQKRGLTAAQLAEMCGVTRQTINNWETGLHKAKWEVLVDALPELRERGTE